jgi:hypothetical protein
MGSSEKITRLHLKAFDLSDYTINQLLKEVETVGTQKGLREYESGTIVMSIQKRIANPKLQPKNRSKLQRVLNWLKGESNVISVDFLRGLSPEEKIEVLHSRLQDLAIEEQALAEKTSQVLAEAKRMVASR